MKCFTTVTIQETESLCGNYWTGRGKAMCRSPKSAFRIAHNECMRQLAAQSEYGGTPILRIVTLNGREI